MTLTDLFGTREEPGHHGWKWWTIEVRFASRLNGRQRRALATLHGLYGYAIGRTAKVEPWRDVIGCDGVTGLWHNSYPGRDDAEALLRALVRVGVKAWVRAAPNLGVWFDGDDQTWCDRVRSCGIGRKRRLPDEWFTVDPLARTVRLGVSKPPFSHWEWSE